MARARTYQKREDGKDRAGIAIWVHLTHDQVHALEDIVAKASGSDATFHEMITKLAEEAIEKAINSKGASVPWSRKRWEWRI